MPLMPRLRRSPWFAGALVLLLAAALVAPVAVVLGLRRWAFSAGLLAALILLFGTIERLWQMRPAPGRPRPPRRGRLRLVPGKKHKGNGHGDERSDGDTPRWVM
jgi:hypothetical protein